MDDNNWKYSLVICRSFWIPICIYYKKYDVELTPDMVMTVYGSQEEGMGHLGMALCDEEYEYFFRIRAIRICSRKSDGRSSSLLLSVGCRA